MKNMATMTIGLTNSTHTSKLHSLAGGMVKPDRRKVKHNGKIFRSTQQGNTAIYQESL